MTNCVRVDEVTLVSLETKLNDVGVCTLKPKGPVGSSGKTYPTGSRINTDPHFTVLGII